MNVKTQTITTEGYPEAGPFETEGEAMGAFVPLLGNTVLSVEHRDDGWYRTYIVSSTTSLYNTWQAPSQANQKPGGIKAVIMGLIKRGRGGCA